MMLEDDAQRALGAAIQLLLKQDLFLLQDDVNERSITHKLAEYLLVVVPDTPRRSGGAPRTLQT
jgi:hypothetical protein